MALLEFETKQKQIQVKFASQYELKQKQLEQQKKQIKIILLLSIT